MHSATHSCTHEFLVHYYGVVISNQERCLGTTESQLLYYGVGLIMTRDEIESKISDIPGQVDNTRYICLIITTKIMYVYYR